MSSAALATALRPSPEIRTTSGSMHITRLTRDSGKPKGFGLASGSAFCSFSLSGLSPASASPAERRQRLGLQNGRDMACRYQVQVCAPQIIPVVLCSSTSTEQRAIIEAVWLRDRGSAAISHYEWEKHGLNCHLLQCLPLPLQTRHAPFHAALLSPGTLLSLHRSAPSTSVLLPLLQQLLISLQQLLRLRCILPLSALSSLQKR